MKEKGQKKIDLLDNESSDEEEISEKKKGSVLSINKKYASKFEKEKKSNDLIIARKVSLESDDSHSDSDSESESEDEEGESLPASLELQIINTINCLRRKDPKIYDHSNVFFQDKEEDDEGEPTNISTKTKQKKYKDVLREQLLTHGADTDDSTANFKLKLKASSRVDNSRSLAYDSEQRELREGFLDVANSQDNNDDDSDDDDVLQLRSRSKEEEDLEQREIALALGEMKDLGTTSTKQVDMFLTDYLTQKRWKDKTLLNADDGDEDDDEEELDQVDKFESSYNFRFEEAQEEGVGSHIVGHSRNVSGTLRREDDKRKMQREGRKEKKEKEKRQKEAELRRLKNLKRQELQQRLEKILSVGGASFDESMLEEDWDPEEYEKQMAAKFNDDYYDEEEEQGLEEEDGFFEKYGIDEYGEEEEVEEQEEEEEEGVEEEEVNDNKKKRKDSKKSASNRESHAQESLEEELYKLDYEDIIAGMPTRFKYRQVAPEGYGLSAEDILLADDDDLNGYVSLKKVSTYRYSSGDKEGGNSGKLDKKRKRLRAALRERKQEAEELQRLDSEAKKLIFPSKHQSSSGGVSSNDKGDKKRKRKRVKDKPRGEMSNNAITKPAAVNANDAVASRRKNLFK